jgi:hypothetical protein
MRKRYDWLVSMVNKRKYHYGAEIGAATGDTTIRLMKQCPLVDLIVADDWRPVEGSLRWNRRDMKKIFTDKLKNYAYRLTILEGLSWHMASQVGRESLDFVFIDASHDYDSVLKDLISWYLKVREGGLFCGHDLNLTGVRDALNDFGIEYKESGVDNVWYIEK